MQKITRHTDASSEKTMRLMTQEKLEDTSVSHKMNLINKSCRLFPVREKTPQNHGITNPLWNSVIAAKSCRRQRDTVGGR